MSKVTSKLQVTIPKAIAERHAIKPGSDVVFESAGDSVRMTPRARRRGKDPDSVARGLADFDKESAEQDERNRRHEQEERERASQRGWRREDLYDRGLPR